MKTHWKKEFNYSYLGAHSLADGNDIIVTILKTATEEVINLSGKKDNCLVVYFEETPKPMVLNRTNSRQIEKLANSPFLEDWPGTKIQLYVQKDVNAFGTITDALRVRDFHPKSKNLDTLPAIQAISQCTTLDQLRNLYLSLSRELQSDPAVIQAKDQHKTTLTPSTTQPLNP